MVSIRHAHSINRDNLDLVQVCQNIQVEPATVEHLLQIEQLYYQTIEKQATAKSLILYALEMVNSLHDLNMNQESIIASMLFPLVHEKYITVEEIAETFGNNIKKLLIGVLDMENIRQLNTSKTQNINIDNIRRMLLAMVDDFRCVIIKLCERIACLRFADNLTEEDKVLVAKECASIYAPLANRLGIGQLKWELEDFSFAYLQPKEYKQIAKLLNETRRVREQYITDFVDELEHALAQEHIQNVKVYGRPKHIYSIWRKMQKKHLEFSELFDVRAIRIIVQKLQDCYATLGVVHTRFKYIPEEFDDYITNPKPNGYQSIHTVVLGPGGKPIEVQIRTEKMHNDAELGVAAHWKYKEGENAGRDGYEEKISWLRKLLAWQDEIADSSELVEEMRSQVFDDRVYVFTPTGEVVDLPTGSTPLDFAYAIHSEIGHRCIGTKVNGKIVPFTYQLQMGEQVEIITQKNPSPSLDWVNPNLKYLHTQRARHKVFTWFKKQSKDKNIPLGKDILEHELHKLGCNLKQVEKYVLPKYNFKFLDDLYAAIGGNDIKVGQIVNLLQAATTKTTNTTTSEQTEDIESIIKVSNTKPSATRADSVMIEGVGNLMHYMAKCCQPIPGDMIAGYITQGNGISIHKQSCGQFINLQEQHEERVIDAAWNNEFENNSFKITLKIIANNKITVLKDITAILALEKIVILKIISNIDRKKNLINIQIEIELNNVQKLNSILTKISLITDVIEAKRLTN